MSDIAKAAAILRQYAGGLYQGHTIGGHWSDGCHIKAEHDEMLALADRLEIAGADGAVAWIRKNGLRFNAEIEPQDDSEVPLYLRADSGRVAELEALVGKLRVALAECVYALEVCGKDYRATEIGREALIPQETK